MRAGRAGRKLFLGRCASGGAVAQAPARRRPKFFCEEFAPGPKGGAGPGARGRGARARAGPCIRAVPARRISRFARVKPGCIRKAP